MSSGWSSSTRPARGKGIKPIIGCDLWLSNEDDRDNPYRILLLAQNYQGYLNLCELLTRAYRSNQYRGRAEVLKAWFAEVGSDGLIALSGAHHGDVGQALVADHVAVARRLAREWAALFPGVITSKCSGWAAGDDGRCGCGTGGDACRPGVAVGRRVGIAGGGDASGAIPET